MALLEVASSSIFCSCSSSSPKFLINPKPSKLHISTSTLPLSLKFPPRPFISTSRKLSFGVLSAVQEVQVEEKPEEIPEEENPEPNIRRKLFVLNLPWSYAVTDIKNLFKECGIVIDVEIIKQKNGKNRGFAFVTMSSGEEAQAVIDKFDSHEVLGRIIRVEFAKRFKRPPPPSPVPSPPPQEARYKIYVSNLAWKARSTHLRDIFAAANFNPVSTRVVFDNPTGRSAGYGFVSFSTKEEADSAISALNGKELMERPLDLKLSEKNSDESTEEEKIDEDIHAEEKNDEKIDEDTPAVKKNDEDIPAEQNEEA